MRLLGEFESPHPMRTPVGVAGCLRHMILKLINSELLHAAGAFANNIFLGRFKAFSSFEILLRCSTSPSAEAPDFVYNLRRQWEYLIEHPDWRETFPRKQPSLQEGWDGNFHHLILIILVG